jgi:DeoR family transcriptional regulator of aga operon
VIGSGGVSRKGGLTEFDQEIADLNRVMVERSEAIMVLADPSKCGVSANYRVAGIDVVDELITSRDGRSLFTKEISGAAQILTPGD